MRYVFDLSCSQIIVSLHLTCFCLQLAVELAAQWLHERLCLPLSSSLLDASGMADEEAKGQRTVTLLIAPTHDNICLWMALARMGYTTQFISTAHMPNVIASLVQRAKSRHIITAGLEDSWVQETRAHQDPANQARWHALESQVTMNGLLGRVRNGEKATVTSGEDTPAPQPFVLLHSFGSTSMPKLYPLTLESANISAQDAAKFWIATPVESRWRCQLQTSVSH